MNSPSHDDDAALPRRTYDLADAQRVFAEVSSKLFGVQADPARVGRFVLLEKIGSGGMGVVYSAFDPELQRRVALKLLHNDGRGESGSASLLQEARALASLQHPNIAAIYEVGTVDDSIFLAMEYVDGVTVQSWATTGRSTTEIIDAFGQVAAGLAYAHDQGLVHRDVKPANLLIETGGRTVVLDFGLAKVSEDDADEQPEFVDTESATQAEKTYAMVGTPAYMAPEQLRGERATAASDQFSFCVSLYEALAGKRPYRATSPLALHAEILDEDFDALPPRTPSWLGSLIARGLRAEPAERWPSLRALAEELGRHRRPWYTKLPVPLAIAGTALATALLASGVADDPCDAAAEEVAGIWSEAARLRVDAALQGRVQDAARTYAIEEIDSFAAALAEARHDACERDVSAAAAAEQECLSGRAASLRVTLTLLGEPDPDVAKHLLKLIPHADSLGVCASPAVPDAVRLPPGERTEVEEALARAATLADVGRTEAAVELASSTVETAGAGPDRALLARAELGLGRALNASGDPSKAVEAFDAALLHAEESADETTRLLAMTDLAQALIKTSRHEEAERLLSMARAVQGRFDAHPAAWDFDLADAAGDLAAARRDYDQALEHYRRAETIAKGHAGDLAQLHSVQSSIAGTLFRLQRYSDATEAASSLREDRRRLYGPDDLGLAALDSLLGVIAIVTRDFASAEVALSRALALRERVQGPEHPALAGVLTNLGALRLTSAPDRAAPVLERALAAAEPSSGPESTAAAKAHYGLGQAYLVSGRDAEALRAFQTAVEIRRSLGQENDPELLLAQVRAGQAQEAHGRCAAARRDFDDVIVTVESQPSTNEGAGDDARSTALAYALAGRARCLAAMGLPDAHATGLRAVSLATADRLEGPALGEALLAAAVTNPTGSDAEELLERAEQALDDGSAHLRLRRMFDRVRAKVRAHATASPGAH